ncbi:MAG: exodeoxyribonuclease VII small subunit [Planctomycetaceae bacterium]|jgi:exodeoxyribonuclease VII small subunit|nr:exodeoxyribonuclease VII small subunit [Planctomycetaceae bacterium]
MSPNDLFQEPESFEEAMLQLDRIVHSLDVGQSSLEASLENYEYGIRILRYCHKILKTAERKIEILQKVNQDGSLETETVDEDSFSTKKSFSTSPENLTEKPVVRKKRVKKLVQPDDSEDTDGMLFSDTEV